MPYEVMSRADALRARIHGAPLRVIAAELDLTIEGARLALVRQVQLEVDEAAMELAGGPLVFDVPDDPGWTVTVEWVTWLAASLAERGIPTSIASEAQPRAGIAFRLRLSHREGEG